MGFSSDVLLDKDLGKEEFTFVCLEAEKHLKKFVQMIERESVIQRGALHVA